MTKKWIDEEIQFLKFAYSNKDFSTKDICEALNRTERSVSMKANKLNLKRYKEILPKNLKRCSNCKTIYDIQLFPKKGDRMHSWCRCCMREKDKLRRLKLENNDIEHNDIEHNDIESKKCGVCKEIKPISKFHKYKKSKDGYYYACIECRTIAKEESKIKKLKERGW